ncbi:SDR family oxidoreductase [Nocardioides sp. HM23]|uniref:SDR family NAD(P)-dependent oxidoreductase n=1 Tax=Nocardioides bizhenqiangii TaxID=3095076 RepID=UPI002ACAE99A|nr:SDR family oxidoreductase [Nocardioides sp. HM23]MDZ5620971.1 SDR family oxidoreductase [Nocardioides sp. HM23]
MGTMVKLLQDKVAVVFGIGAVGGAVARVFASEGARVFLAGRSETRLAAVAIEVPGAVTAQVNAFDRDAVFAHADEVVAATGRIDVAINTVGVLHDQGTAFSDLTLEQYLLPIDAHTRTNFITAQAVSRHMMERRSGVVLTMSAPGARLSGPGFLGHGVANAAVEAFSRILAGELGPSGIRVVCIRPHAIPEAVSISHTGAVFARVAGEQGTTVDGVLDGFAGGTLLGRLPTLADVANYAAFAASDRASAMTGTIGNLTAGLIVD